MSVPLPFLSPVLSPYSPDPDSEHHHHHHHHHHHESSSEHSGSPSHPRKRERVKSFVKHLASPFASPSPPPAHLPTESGSPSYFPTSLSPELEHTPSVLRKRRSSSSVRSIMKNQPSQNSTPSPSPLPSPFPSPNVSRLAPNPNHSNPEIIDPHASPTRKRERVKSFVKGLRRTSSQLFKKDKKDDDSSSRKSFSTISTLVSDSLGVSTAATTPSLLRRMSHSKQPSMTSMTSASTAETDLSASLLDVKIGDDALTHSPIPEVVTPISPDIAQQPDPAPMSPLEETLNEEDVSPGTKPEVDIDPQPAEPASEDPDPLQLPLPPSPLPTPLHLMDPVEPVQIVVSQPEADDPPHNGEGSREDNSGVPASSHEVQSPVTDPTSTPLPIDQTFQPSPEPSPSVEPTPADRDAQDREMRDLCIPVLIPPMLFWPISNMRLSYIFTPVLTWWLSKGVLSYPYLYS